MLYSLLLILALLLGLIVFHLSAYIGRPLREFFADFKTDPDVQKWIEFQNREYCPFWNDLMEIARKNDQAEVPDSSSKKPSVNELMETSKKNEQANTSIDPVKLETYSKKVQDDWNRENNTNIAFVLCGTPITIDMPLSKLLQLVPEGPQNYLDSLNVLNTKMADALKKVNDALKNEGFTPFTREFRYVDNPDTTTTYTSTDGTNITFTTNPKPPEEQKQEVDQQQILITRIKAILQDLDKIREQMKRARQQKAQLDETKKKAEDGSLFSKDGTVPTAKNYGPSNGRLFYN